MTKNWNGSEKSLFSILGASNHSKTEREQNDYYATPPEAVEHLLHLERFNNILEPACGEGHISEVLKKYGYKVTSSDIIDRGYGEVKDFAEYTEWKGDIITNPPYKFALDFVKHAIKIIPSGYKIAMFLKIQFLEGKARKKFFMKHPPKTVYVSSSRLSCGKNGDFGKKPDAVCYCWFIWEKGFCGNPIIRWFN